MGTLQKKQVRFDFKHIACDAIGSSGYILDIAFSATILIVVSIWLTLCAEVLESILSVFGRLGWLLVCGIIIIIQVLLFPSLDKLSWLNGLGLLNALVCVISVLVVSFIKIIKYPELLTAGFTSYKIFDWRGALISYNIYIFSMSTVMVPSIFCEMKDKDRFNQLSRWIYITIVPFKLAFTLIAFFAFQRDTADAVTLNIESVTIRRLVSITIVVDKLLTTPLFLYPVRLQIESILPKPKAKTIVKIILEYLYRSVILTILLGICISVALIVPNFAILTSLLGSIPVVILVLILPVVFWQILTRNKSKLDMAMGLWIIFTSAVSLVGGVYPNLQMI